ncbi:hypothetical protein PLESTB_000268900 [Pleodorina starrii]|uniref:Uncharacterized protein n=1 Tax=Pleodorina starrii TaxID=330485 RepID=A0A9W6BDG4_9CHLO|nr:hypothetical protein PLESTM_000683600 [Pleodorina starrii]GLC49627.1 hypothetical protein PLESTB_000268900 [Pleodorina starrii]GLC65569.1 hypothetical protein PLESTF_000313800 [Pleodorina starrii]
MADTPEPQKPSSANPEPSIPPPPPDLPPPDLPPPAPSPPAVPPPSPPPPLPSTSEQLDPDSEGALGLAAKTAPVDAFMLYGNLTITADCSLILGSADLAANLNSDLTAELARIYQVPSGNVAIRNLTCGSVVATYTVTLPAEAAAADGYTVSAAVALSNSLSAHLSGAFISRWGAVAASQSEGTAAGQVVAQTDSGANPSQQSAAGGSSSSGGSGGGGESKSSAARRSVIVGVTTAVGGVLLAAVGVSVYLAVTRSRRRSTRVVPAAVSTTLPVAPPTVAAAASVISIPTAAAATAGLSAPGRNGTSSSSSMRANRVLPEPTADDGNDRTRPRSRAAFL